MLGKTFYFYFGWFLNSELSESTNVTITVDRVMRDSKPIEELCYGEQI